MSPLSLYLTLEPLEGYRRRREGLDLLSLQDEAQFNLVVDELVP